MGWNKHGEFSGDAALPYFASKATGDVLMKIAKKYMDIKFLVLCGHTHNEAHYQALDNLFVEVGKAECYNPQVQSIGDF